jgi:hypothetical protein
MDEHCTCGALKLVSAYRFANGNVMAFDQFGRQMPYYQAHEIAAERIRRDFPSIEIQNGVWRR